MRHLVPHFILEQYAQGENGGHFTAVSLFADIAGFSAATHALMQHGTEAAEALAEIMQALFEPLVAYVHAHGGFITTFAGDAFTALFPLEQDPAAYQRALAAAVAIQSHMAGHSVQDTRYGRFPLAIKLGLGDGEVEWGILRPAQPSAQRAQNAAYFFSGPAIDAAAAAEHQAQPGNLVFSPTVYAQVRPVVQVLPLADGHAHCLAVVGELPAAQPPLPAAPMEEAAAAFLPPAVWQHESSGDFRLVVAVFIQLLGIATRQDLDIFVQAVFDLLGQFDGYLSRLDFGDKGCNLLLYWGMPTSHENDAQRALSFVLELGNYTPGTFRAGLTQRLMYAGVVGSADRGEYTCYGDGVNLAAHLMQAAPWGSIWLDERLAGRARRHFVTGYVDHLALRGFTEKQAVHALVERRPADEGFFTGQMVGREQELAQLAAFFQPILAPAGEQRYAGVLAVVGEAGVGKSRLVHEFQARLALEPATSAKSTCNLQSTSYNCQFFLCQTDPLLRQPLNPFRYWLMGHFDQSPAQSVERNKRAFSRKLDQVIATVGDAALGSELDRTRSCLGALVGLEWESSLYARLDAPGRYENTLQALQALLKAESLRQPVVLLLEDAHWLDKDSQEFIRRLERQIEGYPLAVLATARPERVGTLFGEGHPYRQLQLPGLSPQELERLTADRLEGAVAPELLALLAERAESNPFFAEQILLYLREQGRLVCRDDTWGLAAASGERPLPDEIRTIFIARLDRLAEEVRAVVQAAAILGREFEVRVLAAMLQMEEEFGAPPAELVELVQVAEQETIWATLVELRYLFKHTLLRDAAYEMQLQAHRRNLHRWAAEALERLYAADLPAHYDEIAYHYEAACRQGLAEVCPQACAYLEQAGKQAAARYENAAALDWFGQALALTPAKEVERRMGLLFAREAVHHLLGRREAQRADLQALAELVQSRQQPAEQSDLALREARLAHATSDFARAQAQAQAAVAAAQAAGAIELEARAEREWGSALWRQGDFSGAQAHGQLGLLLAQAAGCPDQEAGSLVLLGNVAWSQLDLAVAHGHFAQALAINQKFGNRMGEGIVLHNLGNVSDDGGDYAAARRYYGEALTICREIGDRQGEGAALNNLGNVAKGVGDYAAARRYYEQGLAIYRQVGDRRGEIIAFSNLGEIAEKQGDYAAAHWCYEQPLAIYRELGNRRGESLALSSLGEFVEKQGNYAAARHCYKQALAIGRETGYRRGEAIALGHLGAVASAQGNYAVGCQYLEQALVIYREINNRAGEGETLGRLGLAVSAQGDHGAAHQYFEQALAVYRQVGVPRDEGLALHDLGLEALVRNDYAAARRYFEQALAIGREIGSRQIEGLALHDLGQAALAQGDDDAARRYYEQALVIRKELALPPGIAETLAGLALVNLAQGDRGGAQTHVLEMLPILTANPHLGGAAHPRRVLLDCGRLLLALGDPHGPEILAAAHDRLQEQAAQMDDDAARRVFLENVPENRELVAEFARLTARPAAVGELAVQPLVPQETSAGPTDRTGKGQKKAKRGNKGKKKDHPQGGKKRKKDQAKRDKKKAG